MIIDRNTKIIGALMISMSLSLGCSYSANDVNSIEIDNSFDFNDAKDETIMINKKIHEYEEKIKDFLA